MTRTLSATLALAVLLPAGVPAQRLDEYLQTARLSLERESVSLELDLTPGAAIAPEIVSTMDRDGDRVITPSEAASYAGEVLRDLAVQLDGRAVALSLTRIEVPAIDELNAGLGTIRVLASAVVPRLAAGTRVLYFNNRHRPDGSVYQANALVPAAGGIRVAAQRRDPLQREMQVEYSVRPSLLVRLLWPGLTVAVLVTLVALRRRSRRTNPVFMSAEWLHSVER